MQKNRNTINALKSVITFVCLCLIFFGCSDEDVLVNPPAGDQEISAANTTCGCTYTVPVSTSTVVVDGTKLGLKAGAVICLKGGATYKNIIFKNLYGTSTAPITIKNCGGVANINATGTYFGIKTQLCSHIKINGGTGTTYGIKVNGGQHSVTLEYLTTYVEVNNIEVGFSGFSGIMAKTDPSCDDATIRGNFVMRNVFLHDNYVHDTGGEAFYIGHTFWSKGITTPCGQRYPHPLENVKVYNNVIKNSGWEAIQLGSTPTGVDVYYNKIYNYGTKNTLYQNHGVQFSEAAPGKFYGNFIKGGKGNGLIIMGNAENFIHNNVIVDAGMDGIFIEDRATGAGFRIVNNTIIKPGDNGIRLYSDMVSVNNVYNNLIVSPGDGANAYVKKLNNTMLVQMLNNHFASDINTVKFVSPTTDNYALMSTSPVINKGTNITTFNITLDHALKPRFRGTAYDIGAYEFQ